tara:strand:+ start:4227 stop:6575 length:2349 start_codon:yes stop_codon:yes gene_type:complete
MGCLVKSSLSALSSVDADICPMDMTLDQYRQTYNGDFSLNFISALSGIQDFKNLNFTNFYLTDEFLLDDVISTKEIKVKPKSFFTTLNFTTSSQNYLSFNTPSLSSFKDSDDIFNAEYYGKTSFTERSSQASDFEIIFIDDFICRVSTIANNIRYFLVVSDDAADSDNNRKVIFVAENKISSSGRNIEYNLIKYKRDTFINLYSNKIDGKYILLSDGNSLKAKLIDSNTTKANQFFIANSSIKLNQEINLSIPSPYNTSFITYNNAGQVDNSKSDFNLPSNYLLYSSSNNNKLNFNLINLKNIVNTQDQFTSSNNLLSTSETTIFSQNLRKYTSILSDIDSEKNETLALNFVYNNFDIIIKPGTTFFTTPSSMEPFTKLNINDTKFTKCGSFSFKRPDLSDRVYRLDDDSIEKDNVTYLCTWLSGGIGQESIWVDRYYYPDYTTKEEALAASPIFNVTYEKAVENIVRNNATLKNSVKKKLYFDKKSDLTFEPQKRYKYVRVQRKDFLRESPTNFCDTARINNRVNNYFNTINENGGFSLGFTYQNEAGDFDIFSDSNDINGGFVFSKTGNTVNFEFNLFDNSTAGTDLDTRILQNSFSHTFDIDKFEKNNIFLSFNAVQGICNLYLNTNIIFSFEINAFQMFTKKLLFGDIFIQQANADNKIEILFNDATNKLFIDNLYLTLQPLQKYQELGYIFGINIDEIQDLTISLPGGMRNLTDNIKIVNSINTNLKNKSNIVDINVKNLNISPDISQEVKNILLNNITNVLPKTTVINDINFINYK